MNTYCVNVYCFLDIDEAVCRKTQPLFLSLVLLRPLSYWSGKVKPVAWRYCTCAGTLNAQLFFGVCNPSIGGNCG